MGFDFLLCPEESRYRREVMNKKKANFSVEVRHLMMTWRKFLPSPKAVHN